MTKLRIFALVAMIIVCLFMTSACVSQYDYQKLQIHLQKTENEVTQLNKTVADLNYQLADTTRQLAEANIAIKSTQEELASTKKTLTSAEEQVKLYEEKIRLYKETLGIDISSGVQPPYLKSMIPRLQIDLKNNESASNPTWSQLLRFILADNTDSYTYAENIRMCGTFAEEVHNRAEAAGIKAAIVAVQFQGQVIGHALNAFKTTDKGLVYVDCTGGLQKMTYQISGGQGGNIDNDKIAYLFKGKEYGTVSMSNDISLNYTYYEKMKADWNLYASLMSH